MINPYTNEKVTNKKSRNNLIVSYINHYRKQNKMNGGGILNEEKTQNNLCPICLRKIVKQNGGSIRESLHCNHLFHKECLQKIGENKPCVICNQSSIFMNYEE